MFLLDSLMIAGIRWTLNTLVTAAEAEMNDDSALRDRLLEAEMRRELGEISDEEFRTTEADLLARIREIRERREGPGPLALGAGPMETSPDSTFQVEAELSGEFHEPLDGPVRSDRRSGSTPAAGTARADGTPRTRRTIRTHRRPGTVPAGRAGRKPPKA